MRLREHLAAQREAILGQDLASALICSVIFMCIWRMCWAIPS